jgi:hypothetical protein
LRRSSLTVWKALDAVALFWAAIILAYGVIAVTLITGRWALNRIRTVFEHHSALPQPPQDQPH